MLQIENNIHRRCFKVISGIFESSYFSEYFWEIVFISLSVFNTSSRVASIEIPGWSVHDRFVASETELDN